MLEHALNRPRIITLERYNLFSIKHKKKKIELYHPKRTGEKLHFYPHCQNEVIRDVFITNISDNIIQREQVQDTVAPKSALSIAVNIEMGLINQQRIQQTIGRA